MYRERCTGIRKTRVFRNLPVKIVAEPAGDPAVLLTCRELSACRSRL